MNWYRFETCWICNGSGIVEIEQESDTTYIGNNKTTDCPICLGCGTLKIHVKDNEK